jgi:hypothetical protein
MMVAVMLMMLETRSATMVSITLNTYHAIDHQALSLQHMDNRSAIISDIVVDSIKTWICTYDEHEALQMQSSQIRH